MKKKNHIWSINTVPDGRLDDNIVFHSHINKITNSPLCITSTPIQ